MNNPAEAENKAHFIFTNSADPISDAEFPEYRRYWLPEGSTPAELQAVTATGDSSPKQWFAALVQLAMEDKNMTKDAAVAFCTGHYSRIAANCDF